MQEQGWSCELAHFETRERLNQEDDVYLEISFGPLSDEVLLRGRIEQVRNATDEGGNIVEVRFLPGQASRLRYIEEVLSGARKAAARGSRRHPSRLSVNWQLGGQRFLSRLRDISRGGAFILSTEPPTVGARVPITLRPEDGPPLQVHSIVSWIRPVGEHGKQIAGFGVSFKPADPATAKRLSEVVRLHETPAA
jgi:Tfp pilus assembly protein PilZ